jgi:AcrR family transcriptional regulator
MGPAEVAGTKDKILDTAEKLFALEGYSVTSLRKITSEAGVNLAAINYHFQTKEGLLVALLHRRIDPVNEERIEMLDRVEAAGDPTVEQIVRALLEPAIRMTDRYGAGGEYGIRILGKIHGEPAGVPLDLFRELFSTVFQRFTAAFARVLPDLPEDERHWRLHFIIGAMAHTLVSSLKLEEMTCGVCNSGDTDAMVERMVSFAAAALNAPLPPSLQGGTES